MPRLSWDESNLVDVRRELEGLARAEIVAHQGEAEKQPFKARGKAREERRFLLVLKEIELADDEVALLADANELVELG